MVKKQFYDSYCHYYHYLVSVSRMTDIQLVTITWITCLLHQQYYKTYIISYQILSIIISYIGYYYYYYNKYYQYYYLNQFYYLYRYWYNPYPILNLKHKLYIYCLRPEVTSFLVKTYQVILFLFIPIYSYIWYILSIKGW